MLEFSELTVVSNVENTAYKKYFWVYKDKVVSPVFDGFNSACRFEYKGKSAYDNDEMNLYMIPALYSKYCKKILL